MPRHVCVCASGEIVVPSHCSDDCCVSVFVGLIVVVVVVCACTCARLWI